MKPGKSSRNCGTNVRPMRTTELAGKDEISIPSKVTRPDDFGISPTIASTLAVLPAPFGPAAQGNRVLLASSRGCRPDHRFSSDAKIGDLKDHAGDLPLPEICPTHKGVIDNNIGVAIRNDTAVAHDRDSIAQGHQELMLCSITTIRCLARS